MKAQSVLLLVIVGIVGCAFLYHTVYYNSSFDDVARTLLQQSPTQTVVRQPPQVQKETADGPEVHYRLSNLRKYGLVDNLAGQDLDKMTDEELLLTMHSYNDNINIICQRKIRMGSIGDGGWEICDDEDVRPNPPCIIYSFGINYEFSFDDDAAKLYKCHVYSFDPSMTKLETSNRSSHVHFYKIGLNGRTGKGRLGWRLKTLGDIRAVLGHENSVIDVLKIDIESSEWPSIPQMVASGQLKSVRQLLLEYHIVNQTREYLLPKLKAIQMIEKEGFKKFYAHKNPACKTGVRNFPVIRTKCYEVHYIKR